LSMAWRLEGNYFEHCPCDVVCPCTTSGLTPDELKTRRHA